MTRYWFRPKRYGYGATPITWQGWMLTVFSFVAVVVATYLVLPFGQRIETHHWAMWGASIGLIIFALGLIAQWKTDGEWRWQWGSQDGN